MSSGKYSNKRAILLTGTIIPNSIYTNYNVAEKRLADHLKALEFYFNAFKEDDIYFLENSEFDLDGHPQFSELKERLKFKVIRFPKSDKFNEGKGYQEFEMVDHAVDRLKDQYTLFVKITGRYIVTNIHSVITNSCKGLTIDMNRRQKYAQTYLMYFTSDFYCTNLMGEYKNVNDKEGRHIEHVVYRKVEEKKLFDRCSLFPVTPLTEGITGSYGVSLKRNYFRVKVRNVERFFCNLLRIPAFFY